MSALIRVIILTVGVTSSIGVGAATLGEYINAVNGTDGRSKEQMAMYFAGATDALMYGNETLIPHAKGQKLVCFPSPIPSRKTLHDVFRAHAENVIKVGGLEKASEVSLDQLIYASWMHTYPCR